MVIMEYYEYSTIRAWEATNSNGKVYAALSLSISQTAAYFFSSYLTLIHGCTLS